MSLRPARPEEIGTWERWLWQSHGLRTLPGGMPYLCEIDFPMLLVPWRRFEDFGMRIERQTGQMIMTFRLDGQVMTVAEFWSIPGSGRMAFTRKLQVEMLTRGLVESAALGLIWWGIEYPPDSTATTTFLRWFPQNFGLPSVLKAELQDIQGATPMDTSLNLI